jgi:hypothetical protein
MLSSVKTVLLISPKITVFDARRVLAGWSTSSMYLLER